jgi:NADH:ubiquinone oxidoreductase subunit 5 (subunit L)/multisubunit Na+/H+ antiporter MnhA subunit
LGFLLNGFFGRKWGRTTSATIASGAVLASFLIALASFFALLSFPGRQFQVAPFEWIGVDGFSAAFGFLFDLVGGDGSCRVRSYLIHVYSGVYGA